MELALSLVVYITILNFTVINVFLFNPELVICCDLFIYDSQGIKGSERTE